MNQTPTPPSPRPLPHSSHWGAFSVLVRDGSIEVKGTYAGMCTQQVIDHLKSMGVTTIELLPVQAFVDDRPLADRGLRNYWGYNTLGFFAPEPRYGPDNPLDSFRSKICAFRLSSSKR